MATIRELLTVDVEGTGGKSSQKPHRFILFGPSEKLASRLGPVTRVRGLDGRKWSELVASSESRRFTWITSKAATMEALLKIISTMKPLGPRRLGDLLLLETPKAESLPALHSIFDRVLGEVGSYKMLPLGELIEVLSAGPEEAEDLFIGGSLDPDSATLTLTRGNRKSIVVPLSLFRPSGRMAPDPHQLSIADFGHTVRLGGYEASADAILYERDPEYRKRLAKRRLAEEVGFGASLRRLRIQRGLKRTDFPEVSAKTIARIERGETGKPHGETLEILAKNLGVEPKDIESY